MINIVEPINAHRIEEKDKFFVQFFDKKRQITDENLETIDILDAEGKPIYDLYVEIYNQNDPYTVLCKRVDTNLYTIYTKNKVKKHFKYTEIYVKAYDVYKNRKLKLTNDNEETSKIQELEEQLKLLLKQNKELQVKTNEPKKKTKNINENEDNAENQNNLE